MTKWSRARDFIALAVAPLILIVASRFSSGWTTTNQVLLILSFVCSTAAWFWAIGSMVYKLDNQLKLSLSIPQRLAILIPDLRYKLTKAATQDTTNRAILIDEIRDIIEDFEKLRGTLENEQVFVDGWMNLVAQQQTLRLLKNEGSRCGDCGSEWLQSSEILSKKQAKKIIKTKDSGKLGANCSKCGQIIQNQLEE